MGGSFSPRSRDWRPEFLAIYTYLVLKNFVEEGEPRVLPPLLEGLPLKVSEHCCNTAGHAVFVCNKPGCLPSQVQLSGLIDKDPRQLKHTPFWGGQAYRRPDFSWLLNLSLGFSRQIQASCSHCWQHLWFEGQIFHLSEELEYDIYFCQKKKFSNYCHI